MAFFTKFRLRVYALAGVYVALLFALIFINGDSGDLATIRVVEGFGLGAAAALYVVLIAGPLYRQFPNFPGKDVLLSLRGGFGDVALVFGLTHGSTAFWGLLGGPSGWAFLGSTYKTATLVSLTALVLLGALFVFSIENISKKVFTRFPWVGKLSYVAGVFLCAHVLLVGSSFRKPSSFVFVLSFVLVSFLVLLISRDVDSYIANKFNFRQSLSATLLAVFLTGLYAGHVYFVPAVPGATSSTHGMDMSMHGMDMSSPTNQEKYTLSVQIPDGITPEQKTTFTFRVFGADTGNVVTDFSLVHEKFAHLIIVNEALNYYSHIHPDFSNGQFTVQTVFPKADSYRAYLSFEPKGGSEQVFAYSFSVGGGVGGRPDKSVDVKTTKTINGVTVSLTPIKFSAADVAAGKAYLTFRFTDSSDKPITDLYPYLAAFGHLVMIHAETYSYLHVHPLVVPFGPDEAGGPEVKFMVMGNVKPGVYKLFGQFNPHKELLTVPFTIEVTP